MNPFMIKKIQDKKLKKPYLSMLILALVATLVVGGTIAWFFGNDRVTNTLNAGTVIPSVIENGSPSDGLTIDNVVAGHSYAKLVTIRNAGTSPSYIRVKLTPSWTKNGIVLPADNVVIEGLNTTNWVYRSADGYYYYKQSVAAGAETAQLFSGVRISSTVTGLNNTDYQGATLNFLVAAEAIQSANGAALSVWGVDPPALH